MTQKQHDRILDRAVTEVRTRYACPPAPDLEPTAEDLSWWDELAGESEYWREYQEYREWRDWRDDSI